MKNKLEDLLQEYEKTFGELPKIPIMASYAVIADDMKEAIIRKSPLTIEECIEAYRNIPNDQGDADIPEL